MRLSLFLLNEHDDDVYESIAALGSNLCVQNSQTIVLAHTEFPKDLMIGYISHWLTLIMSWIRLYFPLYPSYLRFKARVECT